MRTLSNSACLVLFAISCLFFFSCDEDDAQNSLTEFPLQNGNKWKYASTITTVYDTATDVSYYTTWMEILKDTTINGEQCYAVAYKDSMHGSSVWHYKAFYSNHADGLFLIASVDSMTGGPMFYLKKEVDLMKYIRIFSGAPRMFKAGSSGLFFPPEPLQFLKYPVNLQDQWASHEYGFTDSAVVRKYLSFETTTTQAGTFDCVKLQLFSNLTSWPEVTQHFSAEGLIREVMFQDNAVFGSGDTADVTRITQLVQKNF